MIKRELVLRLYNEHKLSKAVIASKLYITKGSVTQYIQGKRAGNSIKLRKISKIESMVGALAKDIATKKLSSRQISKRFCGICKSVQKKLSIC